MSGPESGASMSVGVVVTAQFMLLLAGCEEAPSPVVQEPLAGRRVVIEMTDEMQFLPADLRVKSGDLVVWRNRGSLPHTTTNDPALAAVPEHNILPELATPWDSELMQQSQEFILRFTTPGDYTYSCTLHEANGMIGRIQVQP